ncbi:hypothetical protein P152DRAFT_515374 [Eremomyces bilateralis CBS 781.70]|uniref:Sacsin/Nov domain-containing protein n=1 Tax=Eremomyces bilateralis CBS 781.70 TaxID=1392243 RepID=A0A6G1FZ57_9PEZI|nr:uncharacterized protein P152DRAFT_515374 [Eremomyces bilateralis CBS 781.70]KAF1810960.1 hypothetical protein P152DRAFT_515374 [Eremomyces bilateralis CBS 781.70]
MDLSRLRQQTIAGGGEEEAVTVNTRALIDKVLARYSSDFTTLRELVQNAADAKSSKVTIKLETLPSITIPLPAGEESSELLKHTLRHHTVQRIVVSNDGEYFREEDWTRLKRIAEGNPDETKIGAFGVGFYSVFADCEEPFVVSGHQTMAFFWKNNSLFTQSGRLDTSKAGSDTTFLLDYREKNTPVPDLLALCRFLCTSITFIALQKIELWVDSYPVFELHKITAPESAVSVPPGIRTQTKDGLLRISSVNHRNGQIHCKWMNIIAWSRTEAKAAVQQEDSLGAIPSLRTIFGKFSKSAATRRKEEERAAAQAAVSEDAAGFSTATVFFRLSTLGIISSVSPKFARELERATKKPPPKQTRMEILTSPKDETAASFSSLSGTTSSQAKVLFESVLPQEHGRIYIGFPTSQTTGYLCHIAAPSVIPTVERESIDLNARHVSTWNIAMLYMAGIACRIAYSNEMNDLSKRLQKHAENNGSREVRSEDVSEFIPAAANIFKQYTPINTTPSSAVGRCIEEGFWECSTQNRIELLSTKGVRLSDGVRVSDKSLAFIESIPIVPQIIMEESGGFFQALFSRGMLSAVTIPDIRKELESRVLSESEAIQMLRWAASEQNEGLSQAVVKDIVTRAVMTLKNVDAAPSKNQDGDSGRVLMLGSINTYLPNSVTFSDITIPEHTIPLQLSKQLTKKEMVIFGWEELHVTSWLEYVVETAPKDGPTSLSNPDYVVRILGVLSRQWGSIPTAAKDKIVAMLSNRPILPTNKGMKTPKEAYFPQAARSFPDLAVIVPELHKLKDAFLKALGVRLTLDLNLLIERIIAPESSDPLTLFEIVKYLASVSNDIPEDERKLLRTKAVWPAERSLPNVKVHSRRYQISELFEPSEEHKRLGLLVLRWPSDRYLDSREMRFLKGLGLRVAPTREKLMEVIQLSVGGDLPQIYNAALERFVQDTSRDDYLAAILRDKIAFIPADNVPWPRVFPPDQLFTNDKATVFGYQILPPRLRTYAARLAPTSFTDAIAKFEYLAPRVGEIDKRTMDILSSSEIVPIFKDKRIIRYAAPKLCILGSSSHLLGDVFDFVSFNTTADYLLTHLGTKLEPTTVDIGQILVRHWDQILQKAGAEGYLELLRKLASNVDALKTSKQLWKDLKSAGCLLAFQDATKPQSKAKAEPDDDLYEDEPVERTWHLKDVRNIVMVDSIQEYAKFRDVLFSAPQDDVLERFYKELGVPNLSSMIQTSHRLGPPVRDQREATTLHKQLCERSRVFLYDHSRSSVLHDASWVEKRLKVVLIENLTRHSRLAGHNASYKERKSASMFEKSKDDITMYITPHADMYDVAIALVPHLLKNPKHNDIIALEMILATDLRRLRAKGYNVDRILRARELEHRVAQQQKPPVAPPQPPAPPPPAIKDASPNVQPDSEKSKGTMSIPIHNAGENAKTPKKEPKNYLHDALGAFGFTMPGAFGSDDSPPHQAPVAPNQQQSLQPPPPYEPTQKPHTPPPHDPLRLQRTLQQAIGMSRPSNANSVFSQPTQRQLTDSRTSYCDATPAQDLVRHGDVIAGMPLYLFRSDLQSMQSRLREHHHSLNIVVLARILLALGDSMGIPKGALNVFWAEDGRSIAFNKDGTLYCNYAFAQGIQFNDAKAWIYWFVTLCHELAHNLVKEHSSDHGFYTESFVHEMIWNVLDRARAEGVVAGSGDKLVDID